MSVARPGPHNSDPSKWPSRRVPEAARRLQAPEPHTCPDDLLKIASGKVMRNKLRDWATGELGQP